MSAVRLARLARWLGPWASEDRSPGGITRTQEVIEGLTGPIRQWIYQPKRPTGAVLLVPGLHFAGPADPRMDRFARVLAKAGYWVCAPFLPTFIDMRLQPQLIDDAFAIFDALVARTDRPAGKPGVFSISFGSLPALRIAAGRPADIGSAILFGGYADWRTALRFSITGGDDVPHDPLNRPIVFINLVEHLPDAPRNPSALLAAWRRYLKATWGKPEMKLDGAWQAVARNIADGLPAALRGLFRLGCGLAPGALDVAEAALTRSGAERDWLDPRPYMANIRCPVVIVHGADDDVIPYTQAQVLHDALPAASRAGIFVSGLYGHTGKARGGAAVREFTTMLGMLKALATLDRP
ncbi:MAG: pimeloyl-ACP methyl ester carboxylesterase [Bradymonadia bacterium]